MPAELDPLPIEELYGSCDLTQFGFDTTDELDELDEIIGQDRALSALDFGVGIEGRGYNLFVLGSPEARNDERVLRFLERRAAGQEAPSDWCYVNNFEDESRPSYLELPAGRGMELSRDIETLTEELQLSLIEAFEGEEYQSQMQVLQQQALSQHEQGLEEVEKRAEGLGLRLMRTPGGFAIAPVRDGQVIGPEQFDQLSEEERQQLPQQVAVLQEDLQRVLRQVPSRQRELRRQARELDREFAESVIRELLNELDDKYRGFEAVRAFLSALGDDMIANARGLIRSAGEQPQDAPPLPTRGRGVDLGRYQVNALVTRRDGDRVLVVTEANPSYPNLVGRIEYQATMGAFSTDFRLIRPGALHLANGGYLLLDARKVLLQPLAWEALKRTLSSRCLTIEAPGGALGLLSTRGLEPEPIPLDPRTKVVLVGDRQLYYLLHGLDPDFAELFKVEVDFNEEMERDPENQSLYARLIATLARQAQVKPLDREAVGRVIEYSARLAGDAGKLSAQTTRIADLVREADYWAGQNGNGTVTRGDVQRAIDAQVNRADRLRERMHEGIVSDTIDIDTVGSEVGQINGLSVFQLGGFAFGRPSRITARVRLGEGDIVDIEREVQLGGALHSKGVMILSGFLKARYAADTLFSLAASLVFEQSYGGVDGDSASSAELYALLSAIAEVPIRQGLAVTGSVNQLGEVQAIGGVNEKIEGFFDICAARGLGGDQGVLIPRANVRHLMLRGDVLEAAAAGRFAIYAATTIDEGMALLTGRPMGERGDDGSYPDGSVNALIEARLERLSQQRRNYLKEGGSA